MRYYDIEIKDAYIAINTNRPQGFDLPVVFLELDSKISRKGYWYSIQTIMNGIGVAEK